MGNYTLKLTKRAFRDIDGIFQYIASEKLSPENAQGQTNRIWKALKTLTVFPQSHQERNEGQYAGKGYRQLIIDNYIAIFRIDDEEKVVYIITIQYQGRNL